MNKQFYFSILYYLFYAVSIGQGIQINEVQSSNLSSFENPDIFSPFEDWIELKNITSSPIDIGGYFLSDDIKKPNKWRIPDGTEIKANSYLIIHAADDDFSDSKIKLNTNFKLNQKGETLILSMPDGTELDRIEIPVLQNDHTYGRKSDGSFSMFSDASPGFKNEDTMAFTLIEADIKFSIESGLYDLSQTVTVTNSGEGILHYTLDGTTPTSASSQYKDPIVVTKNTVLKVIAIKSNNIYSLVEHRTYIINAKHDLPVILLSSDNLSKTHFNKNVIDGRVAFQFIEPNGSVAINQYANFRASGKTSSWVPQLNGKIEASDVYGEEDFDYKMFPNKNIDKYRGFLFRNASQDWELTHLRDAFVSRLLSEDNLTNFPFEGYRPAVLYVNGAYQGIINVREDDDSNYIKDNFNLKKGDFNITKWNHSFEINEDRNVFDKTISFNDIVNLKFLISYTELNEYGFGVWRDISGKTDHEVHYFMHDFDVIFGNFGGGHEPVTNPMSVSDILYFDPVEFPDYRAEEIQFIAALINHMYSKERALGILDDMEAELESEIPAHAIISNKLAIQQEFPSAPFENLEAWKNNMEMLKKDVANRIDDAIFDRIKATHSTDNTISVVYETSNIEEGFIRVHDIKSVQEKFKGTYFSNIPIKFSAEALPGYRFVRWEGGISSTDVQITPIFNENTSIKAVFEAIPTPALNLVINEVQSKNDSTFTDENGEFDDWIEIYNPNEFEVNLADYYISDKPLDPLKWKISNTNAIKTTVAAKGYLLFWADEDLEQGENHLNFKLKANDEVILTAPDATTLIQVVKFENLNSDLSYGAENDGESTYEIFSVPTPGASNNKALLSASIQDNSHEGVEIQLFPNPTIDIIHLRRPNASANRLSWKMYNIDGNKVLSGESKTPTFEIQMQNLAPGVYFLKFVDKINKSLKIIKK
ncbi:lamin tail domain-containing protein [Aquimarina agarilytica]|uniref:lamin tail domain-containing protein n=1 Tax=Aquimarina agarilytica TaxID=1087449 RepID=UPI00028A1CE7|nr:lamin tail domain-containing protein [Aquimarina agarilytica]